MSDELKLKMLKAARAHFEAKKEKAEADISIYLQNPVGVGEHADVTQELINKIEELDHAFGCIQTIIALTKPSVETGENDE